MGPTSCWLPWWVRTTSQPRWSVYSSAAQSTSDASSSCSDWERRPPASLAEKESWLIQVWISTWRREWLSMSRWDIKTICIWSSFHFNLIVIVIDGKQAHINLICVIYVNRHFSIEHGLTLKMKNLKLIANHFYRTPSSWQQLSSR